MYIRILTLFIALACFIPQLASAQKSINIEALDNLEIGEDYQFIIKLKTGSVLVGKILDHDDESISFKSHDLGQITVLKSTIQNIILENIDADAEIAGMTNEPRPKRDMIGKQHYLINSTAYNVDKGEFNLRFTEIFLVSATYGINKYLSVAAGMTFIPGVEIPEQVYYIKPKLTVPINPLITASAHVMPIWIADNQGTLFNGTFSFGTEEKNLSIGYTSSFQAPEAILLNLSGVLRIGKRLALVTDNIFPLGENVDADLEYSFYSIGTRFLGYHGSFDFGFLAIPAFYTESDIVAIPIPIVSYTHRF